MDQLICASLSYTHYWYEVGMLKVPLFGVFASSYAPFLGPNILQRGDYACEMCYHTLCLLTLSLSPCNLYVLFTRHFRLIYSGLGWRHRIFYLPRTRCCVERMYVYINIYQIAHNRAIRPCNLLILCYTPSRARSLRNLLVSGNECGRVFPAGVGPGSPSRDAANWLPSRFSLSVETRRRYGWLRMMVFPGARLFPSPNLVPFGRVAARERQGALSRRAW